MFKKIIQSILVLFLMILLGGSVNAVTTYGEWSDHTTEIEINDGDPVYFDATIFTINKPLQVSIKLYDDTSHLIHTYEDGFIDNTFFSDRYFIEKPHYGNIGEYSIIIYSTDNIGDASTSILSLNVISQEPENTPPVITGIPDQTLDESSGFNDNLIDLFEYANDAETADNDLTYTIISQSNTEVVTCSIDSNQYIDCNVLQAGYSDITIEVSDGILTDTDTFRTTITTTENHAPILNPIGNEYVFENELLEFTISATDPEGNDLTYSVANLPSGANFENQIFSWTPAYDQSGNYNVEFIVSDGFLTDSEVITITISNVNRAPILDYIEDITIDEGDLVKITPIAIDPDEDTLTFTFSSPLNSDGEWQTDYDDAGTYKTTITVSDGSLTDSQEVTIVVDDIKPSSYYTSKAPAKFFIDNIIVYDSSLYPGDNLKLIIGIKKIGKSIAKDIELEIVMLNMDIIKEIPQFHLKDNYVEKSIEITLPHNLEKGIYSFKVIAKNKYNEDIKYDNFFINKKDVLVETNNEVNGKTTVNTVTKQFLPKIIIRLLLVLLVVGIIILIKIRL